MTRNEFIIPMSAELKEMYEDNIEMGNSIKSLQYESIRPKMDTCPIT